uniref:Kinesin motor domain-containing protein n=1 Tax=Glossina morsitans morsitans TaxID=37546 RepID=A0A1B0ESM2_GLOMM
MGNEQKNIKVVVRVRPCNRKELELNTRSVIKVIDTTTLLFDPDEEDDEFFFQGIKQKFRDITKRVNKKMSMEFDRVFDANITNKEIFEECVAPLVDSVLNGYNCSIFAYGATGAGKTFTMLGNRRYAGLMSLTINHLFNKIEDQSNGYRYDLGVSYLEIYNEQVMNLLTKTGPLKLREDAKGVTVSGLSLTPIRNVNELLELLTLGNSNRTQHPTDMNAESSRSHAVFQVHVRMTDSKTGSKRMVKLSMIDLAGSERAASSKGLRLRFKEGASINKSLLALGNCINKLADGLKHIPYRDSNLTRILKDSLGGNCQTLMVANVSMSSLPYEDTYNTLKYAGRAKKIRTTLRQNVLKSNLPKEFYIKKVNELIEENDRLKRANTELELQASKCDTFVASEFNRWCCRIDALFSEILKTQKTLSALKNQTKILTWRKNLKAIVSGLFETFPTAYVAQKESLDYISSCSDLDKETNKFMDKIKCLREEIENLYKGLQEMRDEVQTSKYANTLQICLKNQLICLHCAQQLLRNEHLSSIHTELIKVIDLSYKIIKDAYLTKDQRYHIEALQQYVYEDLLKGEDSGKQISSLLLTMFDKNNDAFDCERQKFLRIGEFALGDELFDLDGLEDKTNAGNYSPETNGEQTNLNETKLLSVQEDNISGDSTFVVSPASARSHWKEGKALKCKSNLVTCVLSRELVDISKNNEKLNNVLLRSTLFTHSKLTKTVATGLQKENRKIVPNRVHKNAISYGTARDRYSCANLGSRQPMRTLNSNPDGLPVRFNRASSLRSKK